MRNKIVATNLESPRVNKKVIYSLGALGIFAFLQQMNSLKDVASSDPDLNWINSVVDGVVGCAMFGLGSALSVLENPNKSFQDKQIRKDLAYDALFGAFSNVTFGYVLSGIIEVNSVLERQGYLASLTQLMPDNSNQNVVLTSIENWVMGEDIQIKLALTHWLLVLGLVNVVLQKRLNINNVDNVEHANYRNHFDYFKDIMKNVIKFNLNPVYPKLIGENNVANQSKRLLRYGFMLNSLMYILVSPMYWSVIGPGICLALMFSLATSRDEE